MIKVKDFSLSYGNHEIVKGASFQAHPGEVTALIGRNGAGKTSLLNHIAHPSRRHRNTHITGHIESIGVVSYLNQHIEADLPFTVFETILIGKAVKLGLRTSQEDIDDVNKIVDMLDLHELQHVPIAHLSGGQRQKVFIGQALAKKPEVLLLDEPTAALDIENQYRIMHQIKDLTIEHNLTTLVCLHQIDLVERFADRVIVLHNGSIYKEGNPNEVFTKELFHEVYAVDATMATVDERLLFGFDVS
ncbi:ABC transporter ATP-binding protein [Corynebacterium cystitidis]|uniref:Iron complex transport system ATP-binding protein n=1 Tax=Corynebacterium cystitidis DSM 20524 TaxID=1121357 RepID=A0A1H9UN42_9CORY|nr:ABC transporter ATP-binding protein [Corynebacterium cystitidis]WJY81032.1 Arginine transport ATP-binding protein ArtM [Corynebacterium cystitidis DSM 20524]SES10433.1 iron complex transport system ATP-binding protein [Corynebacterium cystitidis DSM 20524]SNV90553.1 iron ABC transporter ATP-binding protein [Corynebacterium cystitidis]